MPTGPLIEWQPSCLTGCVAVFDMKESRRKRVARKFLRTLWVLLAIGVANLHSAFGVSLAWDPSPDTNVTGYVIHYGTNSFASNAPNPTAAYPWRVDVGNQTTVTLSNLPSGVTCYFVVTAYAADGTESLPSNEVSYLPLGALQVIAGADSRNQEEEVAHLPPGILQLTVRADGQMQVNFESETGKTYYLQASTNLAQWVTIQELQAGSNALNRFLDPDAVFFPARFYRILVSP